MSGVCRRQAGVVYQKTKVKEWLLVCVPLQDWLLQVLHHNVLRYERVTHLKLNTDVP